MKVGFLSFHQVYCWKCFLWLWLHWISFEVCQNRPLSFTSNNCRYPKGVEAGVEWLLGQEFSPLSIAVCWKSEDLSLAQAFAYKNGEVSNFILCNVGSIEKCIDITEARTECSKGRHSVWTRWSVQQLGHLDWTCCHAWICSCNWCRSFYWKGRPWGLSSFDGVLYMVQNCISFWYCFWEVNQITVWNGIPHFSFGSFETCAKWNPKGEVRKPYASERSDNSDFTTGMKYGCFIFNLV